MPSYSFNQELLVESISNSLINLKYQVIPVICKFYWSDSGEGGTFRATLSNVTVDNINIFQGLDCKWQRTEKKLTAKNAGALFAPTGFSGLTTLASTPQTLLSSVFSSLAEAQAWYFKAGVLSLTESISFAAIQHALNFGTLFLENGSYWVNRSLELFSGCQLIGAGGKNALSVLYVSNNKPLFILRPTAVYCRVVKITEIYAVGSSTDADIYDETKSGLYIGVKTVPEGTTITEPFWYESEVSNCVFEKFSGHGLCILRGFNNLVRDVLARDNKGFGIALVDENSCVIDRNYVGKTNLKGGFYLPSGCSTFTSNNGIDNFSKVPFLVLGTPGSLTTVALHIVGGNMEGSERLIDVYGAGSFLRISPTTSLQPYKADLDYPPIRFYNAGGVLTLESSIGGAGSSPLGASSYYSHDVSMSQGGLVEYTVKGTTARPLKVRFLDSGGANIYGGTKTFIYEAPVTGFLVYEELRKKFKEVLLAPKFYIGDDTSFQAIEVVDVASGLPTLTKPPGIYLNSNTANPNRMFIKTGSGATGWQSVTLGASN